MQPPPKIAARHTLLLLLSATVVVALLFYWRPEPDRELRALPPMRVAATTVERRDLAPVRRVTGRLQPVRRAVLRFEVPGRVVERHVEPGTAVTAGEPLLRLDGGDHTDDLATAEARLAEEKAAVVRDRRLLALAERNIELQAEEVARLERLEAASLASRSLRDEARQRLLQLETDAARLRYSVETAEARLAQRRAALQRARRDMERTVLTAPFDGLVNTVYLDVGDYASGNTESVELIDRAELDLYVEVAGEVAAALTPGQRLTVQTTEGPRSGRLVALQQEPDQETHTHPMRIRIDGTGLLPGALAEAQLPLAPLHDVAVVPVTAVLHEEGRSYLFWIRGGGLERVPVVTGRRVGERYALTDGIATGARIVARDVAALADGQAVVIAEPEGR